MEFIKGEERVLYILIEDEYIPIGCLTSNPLEEESETLETTTRQNNGWKTSIPVKQNYTVSFDGIQVLTFGDGGDSTKLSYDRLKVLKRDRQLIEWKIEDSLLRFIDMGYGYITSISEANQVGEVLTFSGVITGFGTPTASSTPGLYFFEDGEPFQFEDTQPYQFEF